MLIGITGKSGAGKDTVADHICRLDPRFEVRKFATGVRKAAEILTGIDWTKMLTTEEKARDLSDLKFTNEDFEARLGQCIMSVRPDQIPTLWEIFQFRNVLEVSYDVPSAFPDRFVYLNYSVGKLLQLLGTDCFRNIISQNVWVDDLFSTYQAGQYVVISDVRATNEEQTIHKLGGVIIRVVRPEIELTDGRSRTHASENWTVVADIELDNSGTLEELLEKVNKTMTCRADLPGSY